MPKNVESDLTAWIDLKNFEQCKWAFNYLVKQGMYPARQIRSPEDQVWLLSCMRDFKETFIGSTQNKPMMEPLKMSKMRTAWRQKKYRQSNKKRKRRSYNFVLDKEISKRLTFLAKEIGAHRYQTFELLVDRVYGRVERQKNALKEERQQAKIIRQKAKDEEWFNELFGYIHPALLEQAEQKIKLLEEKNDELKREIEQLKSYSNKVEPEAPIDKELKEAFALIDDRASKQG